MTFKNRQITPKRNSWILAATMALVGMSLWSCRTVESDDLAGWQNYSAAMPAITDSALWPASANWSSGTESGNARVPKPGGAFAVSIALWEAPTETVWVDLWKDDVRYARGAFLCEGSASLKMVHQELDTLSAAILRRIHPRTGAMAFDSALAQALVDGDTLVRGSGFPCKHPTGVDTAIVFRKAMLIMVAKELPLAVIAKNWALGVDTLQIHTRIRLLAEQGAVTDTSKIFPPYPVRVTVPITTDSVLVQGGDAKAVAGSFVARDGVASLSVKILRGGQDLTDSFAIVDSLPLRSKPKNPVLAEFVYLRALAAATPGIYQLQVVAKDDSGRSASSSTSFKVLAAPDRDGPNIAIVSPLSGAVLDSTQDSIAVEAKVFDPSGVDSVWIQGRTAVRTDSSWRLTKVFVQASDSGTWLSVRARDRKGNASVASVQVVRKVAKISTSPRVSPSTTVLKPAPGQLLSFDSAVAHVVWKILDPRASVVVVTANGILATPALTDSVWIVDVPVPPTGASFLVRLMAINADHDTLVDSVVVVRAKDALAPTLRRAAGSRGVGVDSASVVVSWAVSDNHKLSSVSVNGQMVDGAVGIYGRSIALSTGANLVWIVAIDSTGNVAKDTVVVIRGANDTVKPAISRGPGTFSRTVSPDTASVVLTWNASDSSLAYVSIGGTKVAGTQGLFGRLVSLATGSNVIWMEAVDSTGNVSTDSVVVVRLAKDTIKPVVVRSTGTSDRTVRFDTSAVSVSWSVADAALKSVSVGGVARSGTAGVYSGTSALSVGSNTIRLAAIDSQGNVSTDSVVVVRLAKDTIDPVVVRSAGTYGRTVRFDTSTVSVSWTVTDAALRSVSIDGVAMPGAAGAYSGTLPLSVGSNTVRLVAIDSQGNVSTDSVVVVRLAKDTTRPAVVRSSGTHDRTVRFDTITVSVSWTVTDAALKNVSIDGVSASGVAGVYSGTFALSVGSNTIRLAAIDSQGNVATDSVILIRNEMDSSKPVLVRLASASDRTVAFDSATTTVSWRVADNALMGVTIDGVEIQGAAGVFTATIPLNSSSRRVAVVAIDSSGNVSTDTIALSKGPDLSSPQLIRIPGTLDTTVANGTSDFLAEWTVFDNGVLQSVTINDAEAIANGSDFFYSVPLAGGVNTITIVAVDGAGNRSTDTIHVTRAAP